MSDLPESAAENADNAPGAGTRWTVWRVLAWLLVAVIFIILVAAAYAWTHRYALIEDAARDLLADEGIDADLKIKSLTRHQIVIDDIRLKADGAPFFEAQSVTADYDWRDALDGKMKRLTFVSPSAWVTIDETGQIIDGWLPPQNPGEGGGLALPPEGILVNDGTLKLTSPFGTLETEVDATLYSLQNFTADLDIKPGNVAFKGFNLSGGGTVTVEVSEAEASLKADLTFASVDHPDVQAQDVTVKGEIVTDDLRDPTRAAGPLALLFDSLDVRSVNFKNGRMNWQGTVNLLEDSLEAEGPWRLSFEEFTTPESYTGAGQVSWDGTVKTERGSAESRFNLDTLSAIGGWELQANKAKLTNNARRKALAEGLTLNSALSNSPVSADFADGLTKMAAHLFSSATITALGNLDYQDDTIRVSLSDPLTLTAPKVTFRATAAKDAPFYLYDEMASLLGIAMDASFTGQYPASLKSLTLKTASQTGYSIDGVSAFSARVTTPRTWQSTTPEGRGVRLAPFAANVNYTANERRLLSMTGGIDYDGDIPGGYVTGLNTSGRLDVRLRDNGLSTVFQPRSEDPITISRFDTPTGWRGENLEFNLISDAPFYVRRGETGTLSAELANASGLLIDDAETRTLDMQFDRIAAEGTLKDGRQDWVLNAGGSQINSDDIVGPGLDVRAPEANMTVALVPDQPVDFTLQSPSADVKSRLVNAAHLQVEASGTPDNFTLDYKKGLIKFTADALPALPMTGDVTFANGEWVGTAETFLPKADDAPIDVEYRFKDGFGEADVTIEKITFAPGKFQPQALAPALRGKVSRVEGAASADIKISFGTDQPMKSSGKVRLMDMNMGTLPGPLTGLSTEIDFTSLFPLQTEGRQTLTVKRFDPGLPLENGEAEYELIPNGVKLYSAKWPMGDGFVAIDPTTWDFGADENRVTLRVDGVSLGDFLATFGGGDIKATGDVIGVLPVVIRGVDVRVEDGVVGVPNGGIIQFESRHTDAAGTVNETADMAFEALKNFQYNSLEAQMDGPLDGDITVLMDFIGSNPEVFYSTKFHFKVNIEGELVNIARSFKQSQDVLGENIKALLNTEKQPKSPEIEDVQ